MSFNICKFDVSKRMLFGIASASLDENGSLYKDLHGDSILPSTLEEACYNYAMKSMVVGEDHAAFEGKGKVIEIAYIDASKVEAMGLELKESTPKSFIWLGVKVLDDELWKNISTRQKFAFSIGGRAVKR